MSMLDVVSSAIRKRKPPGVHAPMNTRATRAQVGVEPLIWSMVVEISLHHGPSGGYVFLHTPPMTVREHTVRAPARLGLGAALALALLFTTGCAGAGFEVGIDLRESTVQGNPLGGLLGGLVEVPIPLDVDVAAETAARDTGPAQAVRLLDLRFFVTETEEPAGDTDDLAFVESAVVFVEAEGLPRVQIAEAVPPRSGERVLLFMTEPSVNLLPYVNAGARLTSRAAGTAPPDDVSFAGSATLSVEVL